MIKHDSVKALINVLSSISQFNDKGASWTAASDVEAAATRRRAQDEILGLIIKIGEDQLPKELLAVLLSDQAVTDPSGAVTEMVEKWAVMRPS